MPEVQKTIVGGEIEVEISMKFRFRFNPVDGAALDDLLTDLLPTPKVEAGTYSGLLIQSCEYVDDSWKVDRSTVQVDGRSIKNSDDYDLVYNEDKNCFE